MAPDSQSRGAAAPPRTGLRRDAARHRARILDAARRSFLDDGLDVPVEVIARRAGVGAATVYRRFPNRAALLDELLGEVDGRLARTLAAPAADPDPRAGLESALRRLVALRVDARCRSDLRATRPEVARRHDRLVESALEPLLAAARAAGAVRRDVAVRDVALLFAAVDAHAAPGRDEPPEDRRRRHADAQRVVTHFVRSFTASGR